MGKSIYSLVLSEEVMRLVDRIADKRGQSRSNFVNEVLAEYLSYETPEMKVRGIFASVENLLAEHESLHFSGKSTGTTVTLVGTLAYRYKPTVRYSVEVYSFNEKSPFLGELKVSSRSGNDFVLSAFEDFFALWIMLEKKYLSPDISYTIEDGKFRRIFIKPEGDYSAAELGKIITDYIDVFDTLINRYFSNLENAQFTLKKLEEAFRRAFQGKPFV